MCVADGFDPLCEDNTPNAGNQYTLSQKAVGGQAVLQLPLIRARATTFTSPSVTYYVSVLDLCGSPAQTVSFDGSSTSSNALGNVIEVVPNQQAADAKAAHDKKMGSIINIAGSLGGVLLALAVVGIIVFFIRSLKQKKDTDGYAPATEEV